MSSAFRWWLMMRRLLLTPPLPAVLSRRQSLSEAHTLAEDSTASPRVLSFRRLAFN